MSQAGGEKIEGHSLDRVLEEMSAIYRRYPEGVGRKGWLEFSQ